MRSPGSTRVRTALAGLAALALAPQSALGGQADPDGWTTCRQATTAVERLRPDLPEHLMAAMAKVESGRPRPGHTARFAWPWTVMAQGEGRYFPTKAAAVAEVKRLRRRGITNIDVGCMQVNLHYHGHAFDGVAQAFDPVHNIAYAAEFLLKLRRSENSWMRAIAYYHSRTPEHYREYQQRVQDAWRRERRTAARGGGAQVARATAR
jgi:hypothetical protein